MSKSDVDPILPETVEVTIFNQTYRLRSKTDKEHLQQIALLVDERMRRISSQVTTHDVIKIAVLTALNIADEMQNLRSYYENEIDSLLSKLPDNPEETAKGAENSDDPESNKSWFEDFFEAKVETKNRADRLSSQVSAKLQSLRESSADQIGITTEDDVSD